MGAKGGILSGIKNVTDELSDIVKKSTDTGMREFATTVKRGKDKTYRPEKTIVRPSKEVEESLAKKLSRATDKELTIDDKKATTIMPAPGKFFNQQSKDFKPPIDKMAREALVEGDPDPIFGMYIDVNAVKNATEKVYQNLFVSGRTAQKSEGLKFDKGEQKFIEYSKAKASPPVSRALSYDGPELLDSSKLKGLEEKERNQVVIDQMKKNFELNTGEKGKEININLLQPDRFSVIIDGNKNRLDHPIVAVHYPTKTKDGHYYTLDTQLVGPVYMKRNTTKDPRTNKAQSPNLKPATVGNIETGLGKQIGVIRIAKPKTKKDPSGYTDHPLYDYIEVDGTAASSPNAPMSLESKFNQGGAVPMQRQMEMFNDGGLKEEGGTKDPVSGNDVPSGSLQEEVRDDIDAKLSPGEFVFPADVVRFIGLEKLMLMRDKAKKGLARMEAMGQMGNSEEATIDDDVPFGMEDLIIVAGSPDNEMSVGGMPTSSTSGAGRFQQIVGQPMFESTTKLFKDDKNNVLYIPFVRGQPVYEPPPGYREVTETEQKQEAATTNVASARVDPITETGSGELGGGPDKGDKSFGEMSPTEKAAFGKDLQDPIKGPMIRGTIGALTTAGNIAFGPNPVVEAIATKFGVEAFDLAKGVQDMYGKAVDFANMTPAELEAAAQSYNDKVSKANEKSVATISTDPAVQATTLSRAYGASPTQIASHIDNISRGNAPPGTSANAFGGFSTSGPGGFSTNAEGDTIGGAAGKQIERAREYNIDLREVLATRPDELFNLGMGTASPTAAEVISATAYDRAFGVSQFGGQQSADPDQSKADKESVEKGFDVQSEVDPGFDEADESMGQPGGGPESASDVDGDDSGQAAEEYDGGLIERPKKKKQKKMKRGGLASR